MHPDRGFEASRLKILLFLVMACWPIYQHRVADRLNKCQTVMSKGRCVSVCKQAFNATILLEASAVCLTNNSQMPAQQKFSVQAGFYIISFFFPCINSDLIDDCSIVDLLQQSSWTPDKTLCPPKQDGTVSEPCTPLLETVAPPLSALALKKTKRDREREHGMWG